MANFPSQHTKNLFPDVKQELQMIKSECDAKEEELKSLVNQLNIAVEHSGMFKFDLNDLAKLLNKTENRLEETHRVQSNRMKMVSVLGGLLNAQESRLKVKEETVELAAIAIDSATQLLKDRNKEKKEILDLAGTMRQMKDYLQQQVQFYEKENARMALESKDLDQVLTEEETLKQRVQEQSEMTRKIDAMKQLHEEFDAAQARKKNEITAKICSTYAEITETQGILHEQYMEQRRIFSKYFKDMEGLKELKSKSEELDMELQERERDYMERKAELMEVNEELNVQLEQEEKEMKDLEERVKQMRDHQNEMQNKLKDFDLEKVQENIRILKEKNEQLDREIAAAKVRKPAKEKDLNIKEFEDGSGSSKVANWLRTFSSPDSLVRVDLRPSVLTSATSAFSSDANGQDDFCEVSSTYQPDIDIFK